MLWSGYLGYLSAWEEGLVTCHGIPIGAVARREETERRGAHNDHRGDRESGEDDDVNGFFLQFEHKRSDRRRDEGGRKEEGHLYPDDAG